MPIPKASENQLLLIFMWEFSEIKES